MNILVCAKQVPNTTAITINPRTNTLERRGVRSIQNPTDVCALGMALEFRWQSGAKVGMVTMGPEQAEAILKDAITLGIEKACLVSDEAFSGSDTYATGSILAAAVQHISKSFPIDLILCGRNTIDGETGQVGPELAEMLNLPQITNVVEFKLETGKVFAKQMTEQGCQWVSASLPALLTISDFNGRPLYRPGIPDPAAMPEIEHIDAHTLLDIAPDCAMGLSGSKTKVIRAFTSSSARKNILIKAATAEEQANELLTALRKDNII